MQVRFWGARGSIAVSGERYRGTGGNTPCVEVEHAGQRLILDGGTGLRSLGEAHGFQPMNAAVLFSHCHWDHIQGVPFFTPAYHPDSRLQFVGFRHAETTLREALDQQMRPPTFPVGLELLRGIRQWTEIGRGETFTHGPFRVTAVEQPHPNGVVAYRIEADGQSVVYATDIEHGGEVSDELVRAAQDTDLLIHDAQYHWAEYTGQVGPPKKGWGHSTWLEAVSAAQRSDARRLALFHHDPTRDDAGVADMEAMAQARFPTAFAAREGQLVVL